jgi:hypothetical protein
MYKKFRPCVPPEHWYENCPEPSNAVLDLVTQGEADKRKSKWDAAGATSTKTSQKKQEAKELRVPKKAATVAVAEKRKEAK